VGVRHPLGQLPDHSQLFSHSETLLQIARTTYRLRGVSSGLVGGRPNHYYCQAYHTRKRPRFSVNDTIMSDRSNERKCGARPHKARLCLETAERKRDALLRMHDQTKPGAGHSLTTPPPEQRRPSANDTTASVRSQRPITEAAVGKVELSPCQSNSPASAFIPTPSVDRRTSDASGRLGRVESKHSVPTALVGHVELSPRSSKSDTGRDSPTSWSSISDQSPLHNGPSHMRAPGERLFSHHPVTNPLFSSFSINDLDDAVLACIFSHLLDPDFPGAVWSGALSPMRRDRLLAVSCASNPNSPSMLLKNVPLDGRPNASTREVLMAQTVCKRWRRVIVSRVVKHCSMFGCPPSLRNIGVESTDWEHVRCCPQMQLNTLVMVAAGPLPLTFSSLGAFDPCSYLLVHMQSSRYL
jgi:hypothetical protein